MAKVTVKPRPKTVATVPDEEIGSAYVSRKLVGGRKDIELLDYAQQTRKNVLLKGPTGSGKTAVGRAFAALTRQLYYSLPCDISIDPTALFGKMMPREGGGFEWVDGPVTALARHGGVLNISEVNFMSPKIAASLYPLLDSRRQLTLLGNKGEVIEAHDRLLIIADMNPNYRGTQQLNAAFLNRFPLKVQWDYDPKVEASLVESASLAELAKKLRASNEVRTPVSTNMLMEFVDIGCDLGYEFAAANFLESFEPTEVPAIQNLMKLQRQELESDINNLTLKRYPSDEDASESASGEGDEPQGVDYEPEFELDDEEDDEDY